MTVSFLACGTSSCTFLHFLLGWRVSGHVRTCGLRTRIHPSFLLVCSCLHIPSFILVHNSTSTGLSSSAKRSQTYLFVSNPNRSYAAYPLFLPTFPYSFLTYLRICETADPTSFSATPPATSSLAFSLISVSVSVYPGGFLSVLKCILHLNQKGFIATHRGNIF